MPTAGSGSAGLGGAALPSPSHRLGCCSALPAFLLSQASPGLNRENSALNEALPGTRDKGNRRAAD